MKIYTKTGDHGETGLVGGSRVPKNSARINAIGDVDELNAAIGFLRSSAAEVCILESIQSRLFDIGAELASPSDSRVQYAFVSEEDVKILEDSMDEQTQALPTLTTFILPSGCEPAARAHMARSVCRRAERSVLELNAEESQRLEILAYLNRLSDWLFVLARTLNARHGVQDVAWKGRA